jgi:N-acetylglutamate synthase-like GNAT family acetyltransferase
MIEMFQEWYDNRHEYAKDGKERTGGKVVGFILGDASGWEYGVPNTVGWIDTIGVYPDYQKEGIARVLLMEMVDNLKKVGVDTIYTFVNWRDWGLLQFFDAMGFQRGDMVNLELKI